MCIGVVLAWRVKMRTKLRDRVLSCTPVGDIKGFRRKSLIVMPKYEYEAPRATINAEE